MTVTDMPVSVLVKWCLCVTAVNAPQLITHITHANARTYTCIHTHIHNHLNTRLHTHSQTHKQSPKHTPKHTPTHAPAQTHFRRGNINPIPSQILWTE